MLVKDEESVLLSFESIKPGYQSEEKPIARMEQLRRRGKKSAQYQKPPCGVPFDSNGSFQSEVSAPLSLTGIVASLLLDYPSSQATDRSYSSRFGTYHALLWNIDANRVFKREHCYWGQMESFSSVLLSNNGSFVLEYRCSVWWRDTQTPQATVKVSVDAEEMFSFTVPMDHVVDRVPLRALFFKGIPAKKE